MPPAVVMVELDWELGKDAAVKFVDEVSQLACGAAWQATHRLLKGVAIVERAAAAMQYSAAVCMPAPGILGAGLAIPVLKSAEDFTGKFLGECCRCMGRS